jgi:tRNA pseudouridine38-40 synthase
VFYNDYALFHNKKINIKKIKEASKLLIGRHDFLSFSISENENTVREIKTIKTIKKNNFIIISVVGTGFLRGMVRMIVGTLLDYSDGKKTINDIKKLLLNPKKGSAITKVKACGLYLNKVKY